MKGCRQCVECLQLLINPQSTYLKSHIHSQPSITDGVYRNENFVEIIPVFSTFSKFFKVFKKKLLKPFHVTFQCGC